VLPQEVANFLQGSRGLQGPLQGLPGYIYIYTYYQGIYIQAIYIEREREDYQDIYIYIYIYILPGYI